jgi:STE24 endopeptidase
MLPTPVALPLSPAELARARQYLYGGLLWGTLAQIWTLALLAFAYYGGWAARCARAVRGARPALRTAAVSVGVFAFVLALSLPWDLYLDYFRERAFGFERLSPAGWFGQWGVSALVYVIAGLIVAELVYGWLRRPPRRWPWWIKVWIILSAGAVLGVAIEPVVLAPLFNRFTPLPPGPARAEIERLAARAGIPQARIEEVDASLQSSHTNAYVDGVLGSQRIVVYDTLLRSQTLPELSFVVGHEIGHYVLHHLWKGLAFTVALLFALCGALAWLFPRCARGRAPTDPVTLPLALLLLLGLLFFLAPATNGFSRWEEHQADAFGLRLSGHACAAVRSFEREERTDLIYPDPPAWVVTWFFNHPSQQQRIDFARHFCRVSGSGRRSSAARPRARRAGAPAGGRSVAPPNPAPAG